MTLPSPTPPVNRLLPVLAVLTRWGLGALYIYMGWVKAMDPVDFLKLVRQYDLVQQPYLLNFIAISLPWFEIFCGVLLVSGIAVRGSALMSLVMLIPFTLIVLKRALAIQAASALPFCDIRFDCGCGAGEVAICFKLAENTLLILLSVLLLIWRSPQLCIRYQLFK